MRKFLGVPPTCIAVGIEETRVAFPCHHDIRVAEAAQGAVREYDAAYIEAGVLVQQQVWIPQPDIDIEHIPIEFRLALDGKVNERWRLKQPKGVEMQLRPAQGDGVDCTSGGVAGECIKAQKLVGG